MIHPIPLDRFDKDNHIIPYKNGINYYQKNDRNKGFVLYIRNRKKFSFIFSIHYTDYGYLFVRFITSWDFEYNELHGMVIPKKVIKWEKDWLLDKEALAKSKERIKEENRLFALKHPEYNKKEA